LYRAKLNLGEAMNQLDKGSGTQFDAKIVEKFLLMLNNFDIMAKEVAYTYQ
jgi:HD-GYP domain-containing protein (c-di-GMP phosphodiesterase class II)